LGLRLQRGRRCRGLLDHGGGFLRGALDIRHRIVHRRDARRLLGRGAGDLGHDLGYAVDGVHHIAHGVARQVDVTHAGVHALGGVFNQPLDLPGRLGAALGERTHLARHHRKTLALFPGACSFHRRVQRKNVGLERNAVHDPHDLADSARAVRDALHAVHHFLDGLAAPLRQLRRAQGLAAGQIGVSCGQLHGMRQLRHVGRGLLQRTGLPGRAVGHVRAARRDLASARVDFLDAMAYRRHGSRQPRLHAAHG